MGIRFLHFVGTVRYVKEGKLFTAREPFSKSSTSKIRKVVGVQAEVIERLDDGRRKKKRVGI